MNAVKFTNAFDACVGHAEKLTYELTKKIRKAEGNSLAASQKLEKMGYELSEINAMLTRYQNDDANFK